MEHSEISNRIMNGARERKDWPETAMKLAQTIADMRSEDPYVQVGACGIKQDGSVVLGYNGSPSGFEIDWTDRDGRRNYVLHAESNLLDLTKIGELKFIATTHLPCKECIKRISKYKVPIVYYKSEEYVSVDVSSSFKMAEFLKIKLVKI